MMRINDKGGLEESKKQVGKIECPKDDDFDLGAFMDGLEAIARRIIKEERERLKKLFGEDDLSAN